MTGGSLFTGGGGFELGLEQCGLVMRDEIRWQVENNRQCIKLLERYFPGVRRYGDIRECITELDAADIVFGGDPCPIRSRARADRPTKHPDLSGYFLAVVGRGRPRWVLRENVPAPDDHEFTAALELLGYRAVIVGADSAPFTGQHRRRDFIVGCLEASRMREFEQLYLGECGTGIVEEEYTAQKGYPCLTTNGSRYNSIDGYIWDGSGRLRIADSDERTRLAGFPDGWFNGLSKTSVERITGNAVTPQVVSMIGEIIRKAEKQ